MRGHADQQKNIHQSEKRLLEEQMTEIFTSIRDLHTNYLLPAPFNGMTAFLPFMVEDYIEGASGSISSLTSRRGSATRLSSAGLNLSILEISFDRPVLRIEFVDGVPLPAKPSEILDKTAVGPVKLPNRFGDLK